MEKISEYLKSEITSHDIYNHDMVAKEFKERTGHDACWPTYTPSAIKEAIEKRGLGGSLSATPSERLANGWEIAESLAYKYADYNSGHIEGRGSRFRLAITTLEKAGY